GACTDRGVGDVTASRLGGGGGAGPSPGGGGGLVPGPGGGGGPGRPVGPRGDGPPVSASCIRSLTSRVAAPNETPAFRRPTTTGRAIGSQTNGDQNSASAFGK